jgi:O-antigen/teichoic acid export membrane protein
MNRNVGEAKSQGGVPRVVLARMVADHTPAFVAGSAWISRVVIAFVQLASIRILMGSLGLEQYAMYALLMGLLQWYMLADIGLGISTQNRISECRAREASYRSFVAAAGVIAIGMLILSIVALYFASPTLARTFLKAFPDVSHAEKTRYFFLAGTLFISAGIGNISYKIWYAEQKGYLAHIVPAIASLLGLLGIVLLDASGHGGDFGTALFLFNAPAAALALGSLLLEVVRNARGFDSVHVGLVKNTLARAMKFWLTAILGTIALQVDTLVISQLLSPHQMVVYVIATKIFGFIAFFFTSILWALWPNFAEWGSVGDWRKVKQSLAQCIRLGMLFVASATVALVYAMPYISEMLAPGQSVRIPVQLTLLLGAYQLIRVWNDVYSVVLQSMNVLWPLWVFMPIQAAMSVGFQYKLAPIYGVHGIVLGMIASFVLTVIWGLPLATKRQFNKLLNLDQVRP